MSFPRYPKYKDSGVEWIGLVPEHWDVGQSRRLFALRNERALPDDKQLTASQEHGVIYQEDFIRLEGRRVVEVIKGADILKHVEPNDFVISMRSFQGGIEWCRRRGCISSAYVMLIPSSNVFCPFFAYLLKSKSYVQALQTTTNLVRDGQALRYDNFAQVPLPVVPIDEQTAIAAFLDRETAKIDALVAEQERLIELLKEKRQAVISHAVTKGLNPDAPMKDSGVEWLGEIPAHWVPMQVGRVCRDIGDGPHFSPRYVDEGVLFVSARNVRADRWALEDVKYISEEDCEEFDRRIIPERGDVLYTKGGTTGIARVVDLEQRFQVWVHVAVLKIKPETTSPHYIAYALNSNGCYEQSQLLTRGATNNDLGLTRIVKIWFALPPLAEQRIIVKFLASQTARLDALINEAHRAIELLQERRTALISAAVTGQIDVRDVERRAA